MYIEVKAGLERREITSKDGRNFVFYEQQARLVFPGDDWGSKVFNLSHDDPEDELDPAHRYSFGAASFKVNEYGGIAFARGLVLTSESNATGTITQSPKKVA